MESQHIALMMARIILGKTYGMVKNEYFYLIFEY